MDGFLPFRHAMTVRRDLEPATPAARNDPCEMDMAKTVTERPIEAQASPDDVLAGKRWDQST
jgi:hypothetical protein